VRNLKEGRIWTPITTAISTDQPFSVLVNGFTLYFLGGTVMRMLGTGKFLGLYFGASVLASAAHVVYQSFFTPSYTQQQRWLSENAGS
jgi:membrane associated rhomboid family serine protease